MRDPEFVELRNKFLLGLGVAILFAIPIFFFVVRQFRDPTSDVSKMISKKETMLIYFYSSSCSYCSRVQDVLDYKKVSYHFYDISATDYDEVLRKLGLSKEVVEVPALVYVKDGKMVGNVMKIQDEESVLDFLDLDIF